MKKNATLSAFGFFTLTAAMLMSADEYPAFAQSGLMATLLLIVAGIFWFLPVALASAQMATMPGWSDGGVYTWVKGALGQRAGFVAVFFQWLQITVNFMVDCKINPNAVRTKRSASLKMVFTITLFLGADFLSSITYSCLLYTSPSPRD